MITPFARSTRAASAPNLGTEFNRFLFASIGEESNGMSLSVVSALSRNGFDPWQEAAALARLPVEAATQSVAAWVERLSDIPSAQAERFTIAARLVALLPGHPKPLAALASPGSAHVTTPLKSPAIFYVLMMVLAVCAQLLIASRQSETPPKSAPTTAAPAAPVDRQ
jgi:hypothetical protein